MANARRAVCLFGTSADPPTSICGHKGIVSYLSKDLNEFDEVRVLPVYRHMFATKRGKQASFTDRMEMCRLAFQDVPKVTVSDAEQKCFEKAVAAARAEEEAVDMASIRVGTADVLDMLKAAEPNTDFTFTLGSDTFIDFSDWKWRRSKDVVRHVEGRLLVIHRKKDSVDNGEDHGDYNKEQEHELQRRLDTINSDWFVSNTNGDSSSRNEDRSCLELTHEGGNTLSICNNARIVNIPSLTAVSSTLVRSTRDETLLSEWITPETIQYIKDNRLYAFDVDDN